MSKFLHHRKRFSIRYIPRFILDATGTPLELLLQRRRELPIIVRYLRCRSGHFGVLKFDRACATEAAINIGG
jgi:hypothetical protein